MSDDNLSKVASECADKLRGMEAVIPPPVPKPILENKFSHNFSFTFHETQPWWDEPLMMVAAIGLAAGFICIGFAIAASVPR